MAVAGPERLGSGRGVPVPSMTTCVDPFAAIAHPSIDVHAGRLDHLGPEPSIGLDACLRVGAPGPFNDNVLHAELLLELPRRQGLMHLMLQKRSHCFWKTGWPCDEVISFEFEIGKTGFGNRRHFRC